MIYDNHQFLTAGKVRGNDSAWTDIMNLIFFPLMLDIIWCAAPRGVIGDSYPAKGPHDQGRKFCCFHALCGL